MKRSEHNTKTESAAKSAKQSRFSAKRLAVDAILASLAMILAYVEYLLPPITTALPGVKIGLPNVAVIAALYLFGWRDAVAVSFVRLFLSALAFGNALTFAYSAAGAVFSLCVMILLKKLDVFSTVGVSVAGGIFHNVGQILVAMLVFATAGIAYYLIVLTVTGVIAGAFVGFAASFVIKLLQKRIGAPPRVPKP